MSSTHLLKFSCTSSCPPSTLFPSRKQWATHEETTHHTLWICPCAKQYTRFRSYFLHRTYDGCQVGEMDSRLEESMRRGGTPEWKIREVLEKSYAASRERNGKRRHDLDGEGRVVRPGSPVTARKRVSKERTELRKEVGGKTEDEVVESERDAWFGGGPQAPSALGTTAGFTVETESTPEGDIARTTFIPRIPEDEIARTDFVPQLPEDTIPQLPEITLPKLPDVTIPRPPEVKEHVPASQRPDTPELQKMRLEMELMRAILEAKNAEVALKEAEIAYHKRVTGL